MKPARSGSGEDLIRGVQMAPSGSSVAGLFDLDRTLIAGYSVIPFVLSRVRTGRATSSEIASTIATAAAYLLGRISFDRFLDETAASARGLREGALLEAGEEAFARHLIDRVHPEARRLVDAHRRRGHFVAIITSATRYQVEPIARHLGIEQVACSGLELVDGVFTGRARRPSCFGAGKLAAARRFASRHGFELERAHFYSDGDEDLPLLEAVGHPRPVNPSRRLARISAERGWATYGFRRGAACGSRSSARSFFRRSTGSRIGFETRSSVSSPMVTTSS